VHGNYELVGALQEARHDAEARAMTLYAEAIDSFLVLTV
jgi:hypothetical protein